MPLSEQEIAEIRTSLKRCSQETIEAAIHFRETGDAAHVSTIVAGIIERYLPPESNVSLKSADDSVGLMEDLGIDSLTMLEIVLSIEEALSISIPTEELREIRTLGDAKTYIQKRLADPSATSETNTTSRKYSYIEIATILPQQSPFLFVDSAQIEGDTVHATYEIKGTEDFLEGHFKDNPIFPASIIFEALGQTACLWVLECAPDQLGHPLANSEVLFASMNGANVYRKTKPGDLLEFEVKLKRLRDPVAIFSGKVTVNGEKAAKIDELMLAFGSELESAAEIDQLEEIPATP